MLSLAALMLNNQATLLANLDLEGLSCGFVVYLGIIHRVTNLRTNSALYPLKEFASPNSLSSFGMVSSAYDLFAL